MKDLPKNRDSKLLDAQRAMEIRVTERAQEVSRLKALVDSRDICGSNALFIESLYKQCQEHNAASMAFLSARQTKWLWSISLEYQAHPQPKLA